ncbi:MAG: RraA family protein, partial [Planctomycetia bacterium]
PAVVVFQDLDSPAVSATFGEVMCSTYRGFGAAGLVTSGAGRDLEQVRRLGFPAFTGGTICAHGYCHVLQLDVPVHVGGLTVHPGDLLHGDANGVTTIPSKIAKATARACKEFLACEDEIMNYVKAPNPTVAGVAERRKSFQKMVAALRDRLLSESAE